MTFGGGSRTDPFYLADAAKYGPAGAVNSSAVGRTQRDPRIIAGEDTAVFIVAGQSHVGNYATGTFTPTNGSKLDNLNIIDGGVYAAADPALGTDGTGAHWPYRMADAMITAGMYDRVILVPIALNGTAVAEWAPGGAYSSKLTVAFARCAALSLPVTGVIWQLGEQDKILGTSQAAWEASFDAMVAAQVALGNNVPWFVVKSTMVTNAVSATIQAAQDAVLGGSVYTGGNCDSLTGGTNRQGDGTHLTATGAAAMAALAKTAIDAVL